MAEWEEDVKRQMFVLIAVLGLAAAAASAQTFTAPLAAEAVLPNPGPEGGLGFGIVTIDGTNVTYQLAFTGVASPTAAHIHVGAEGETGGVVIDFSPTFVDGTATGTVTADQNVVDDVLANPSGYYIQVHSA